MKQQTIKFSISQDGSVEEIVQGIKGANCLDITEKIEEKLGTVQHRKETEEYYQVQSTQENVTLHQDQHQN